jgi:predicted DCC family thiol-disulfide oxidoreductase YuxK
VDIRSASERHGIVLYDGVCGLCDRSVRFIIKHDGAGYFRFAALQLDVGKQLMAECGRDPDNLDTLILIEDGQCYAHSTAALRIASRLDGPWRHSSKLLALPALLRDPIYKAISRVRYALFGKKDECEIPEPEERQRFLDAHLC